MNTTTTFLPTLILLSSRLSATRLLTTSVPIGSEPQKVFRLQRLGN